MDLSRQDCSVLRGMAIISIFIHNYCHLLPNAPEENEYSWSIDRVHYFWSSISNDVFISFFSFWGHYGVPVFVFLSGYGLVKKYEGNDVELSYRSYVSIHYRKLFRLLLPGLFLYLFLFWLLYGSLDGMTVWGFVTQLLFVNNLIPTNYSPIIPGPYWYFGLTMQLYLVFLFLYHKNRIMVLFIVICVFFMVLSNGHHYLIIWFRYNFIGNVIPFIMGVFYARYVFTFKFVESKFFLVFISFFSFALLLVFEFNYFSWIFASILVIICALSIVKLLNGWLVSFLSFIGAISHFIFVSHPVARVFAYYMQDEYHMIWQEGLFIYILLTMSLSSLFFYLGKIRGAIKDIR